MKSRFLKPIGLAALLALGITDAGAQEKGDAFRGQALTSSMHDAHPTMQSNIVRYRIRVGDALEISFRFTPEFDQTVTVQPDGFISLRDFRDLHVAGTTTQELTDILEKTYSGILKDPVVTVTLKEFEKPYFIALGELGHPGKYELRGDTTVVEAIGMAGGFNEKSKHSQVLLFRRISDQWTEVKKLDMKAMLGAANLSEDLHLRPGDMVYVPQNLISKIKPFIPTPSMSMYAPFR